LHDDELNNFLFVGSFRDEDPELTATFLDSIMDLTVAGIVTDMPLSNLDINGVNLYLANKLKLEPETAKPLAQVVHRKTGGNPYYFIQLLEQIQAQNLFTYNFGSLKWEFDIESVSDATDLADNVADLVTRRLQRTSARVLRILKLAACLGYYADIKLLQHLDLHLVLPHLQDGSDDFTATCSVDSQASSLHPGGDEQMSESAKGTNHQTYGTETFEAALQHAEEEAFVERAGGFVRFTHDRVQQCVYDLIDGDRAREMLHYQIGLCLMKECHNNTAKEESSNSSQFLLAVDQLNRGSALTSNNRESLSLIEYNCQASKLTKKCAGIEAGANFLRQAIQLIQLQPLFWTNQYELVLDVYSSFSELAYSLGMLEEAKLTIQVIVEKAIRKIDMVRALVVEFQMYVAECQQYEKVIALYCNVLELLGESVPKKITKRHVVMEYNKARRECKNKDDDFFTTLPAAQSNKIKIILRVLQIGTLYGFISDLNFGCLASLRAFRVTIREGSTAATPWSYSAYGWVSALFGNFEEAFRFGQLSLKTKEGEAVPPPATAVIHSQLAHLQRPLSLSLEPCLSAYRVGLTTGDLVYGTVCIVSYAVAYIACGLPLRPFADDIENFGRQMKMCHQDLPRSWLLPSHQLCINLMGMSEDPLDISREAIERHHPDLCAENLLLYDETSRVVPADILYMWYLQLYNAYVLNDLAKMDQTLKQILALKKSARRFGGAYSFNYFLPFMDGLVGLYLAKKKPKSKTGFRVSQAAIAELKGIAKTRPVNSMTTLKLLRAEKAASQKSTTFQEAKVGYDEAISEFSRSGLNHFCAIANELAGKYMLEKGDADWAQFYLCRAYSKWYEYGAFVKAEQMEKQFMFLVTESQELQEISKRGTFSNVLLIFLRSPFH